MDLAPGEWGDVWQDPALVPLLMLGGGLEASGLVAQADDPERCDECSRAVPDAALHMLARLEA